MQKDEVPRFTVVRETDIDRRSILGKRSVLNIRDAVFEVHDRGKVVGVMHGERVRSKSGVSRFLVDYAILSQKSARDFQKVFGRSMLGYLASRLTDFGLDKWIKRVEITSGRKKKAFRKAVNEHSAVFNGRIQNILAKDGRILNRSDGYTSCYFRQIQEGKMPKVPESIPPKRRGLRPSQKQNKKAARVNRRIRA